MDRKPQLKTRHTNSAGIESSEISFICTTKVILTDDLQPKNNHNKLAGSHETVKVLYGKEHHHSDKSCRQQNGKDVFAK